MGSDVKIPVWVFEAAIGFSIFQNPVVHLVMHVISRIFEKDSSDHETKMKKS